MEDQLDTCATKLPALSDDELILLYKQASSIEIKGWLLKCCIIGEARSRATSRELAAQFGVVQREIQYQHKVFTDILTKREETKLISPLGSSWFIEALKAPSPLKAIDHAEDEYMTNKSYSIKDFKKYIVLERNREELNNNKRANRSTNKKTTELLEGDFFKVINKVEDKSIDCIIADPPYNVTNLEWDKFEHSKFLEFTDKWVKAIIPKLKDEYSFYIFCSPRYASIIEVNILKDLPIKNRIVWVHKNMSMGRQVKDAYINSYDVCFYISNKSLNLPQTWGKERLDVKEFAMPQTNFQDKKYHETQKPKALISEFIELATNEGELVLDPFAGSGTTGVVCKKLKRNFILIEREPEYIDIIKKRLACL